jgi:hypothetical protein
MIAFTFGPPQRRLFGLYHAPAAERAPAAAVLLCYPFGHEALRVHRFYRLLAERLARQGVAVLRFDYHATGDSDGADEDGEMVGWAGDIREAHRELVHRSGVQQVSWFGARLGASLALMAAPQAVPPVRKLVLWDALFDGPAYLEELRRAHVDELELAHNIPDAGWRRALARDPMAFSGECLGFAISPRLRKQLGALGAESPAQLGPQQITLLADPQDKGAQRWAAAVPARHPVTTLTHTGFKHPLIWTSNPFANNEMVPAEALQVMIGALHAKQ